MWVQGCPFRCPGCFNEDFQPFVVRNVVEVNKLAGRILNVKEIEGVTYSGGEPMVQAEALYWLSTTLKRHGLTILCYTGFTLEQLHRQNDPYVGRLLGLLDILIDGPYLEDKRANLLWRGSANQRVHFLTNVYLGYKKVAETGLAEMEIIVGKGGITLTGMLQEEIARRILQITCENKGDGEKP
jgi:anaerobic ribonucleoside-triphosphate reductase activating protein